MVKSREGGASLCAAQKLPLEPRYVGTSHAGTPGFTAHSHSTPRGPLFSLGSSGPMSGRRAAPPAVSFEFPTDLHPSSRYSLA